MRFTSKYRPGFTLIELLVVIAIIAILAAILFPVFATAREKARQTSCLSNCKQQALAVISYDNDYDETYPLDGTLTFSNSCFSGIYQELSPYEKSAGIFICPDAPTLFTVANWNSFTVPNVPAPPFCTASPMPLASSYTFNSAVINDGSAGLPATRDSEIGMPDITAVIYDGAVLLSVNLPGTNPPTTTTPIVSPGSGSGVVPSTFCTSGNLSPINPVHSGNAVTNSNFADGHAKAIHVQQYTGTANGAPATCTGIDGGVVPIGQVVQAGPYQGGLEIYGIPSGQNSAGVWSFANTW